MKRSEKLYEEENDQMQKAIKELEEETGRIQKLLTHPVGDMDHQMSRQALDRVSYNIKRIELSRRRFMELLRSQLGKDV